MQVGEDVVYTQSGRPRTLIVAEPAGARGPAVVHFHGGAFRKGQASRATAEWLARNGFVGVSVNYRLSGEALFPAAVHDCKAAVRWLRAHAADYGVDPDRIGAFGGSAGGHLAALVGASAGDAYLEGQEGHASFSSAVQAVVSHYGPTDFLRMNDAPGRLDHDAPDSPESAFIGGPIQQNPEQARKASPLAYISETTPPVLMVHGREDMAVPFDQSQRLYAALRGAGVAARLVPVENAGHGFKPARPGVAIAPERAEIEAMTLAWLRDHL